MLETWLTDARFALRLLRKSPLFTVTAVVSLAIGIGANTTIFSIASAMLLRPLPGLAAPDRLVDIGRQSRGAEFDTVSYPNFADIRERARSFSGIYAHQLEPTPLSLGVAGEAERVYGTLVSGDYFSTLGATPAAGRLLGPGDDAGVGASPVIVIAHALWTRRFGSDPTAVGSVVRINGSPFTIVGVAPPGFQGTTLLRADVWLPVAMMTQAMPDRRESLFTSRRSTWLFMGGRLKESVTLEQANAELEAIGAALEAEHPVANRGMRFRAAPVAVMPGMTGMVAAFIGLLMGIVTLLLLIACVNLAGMMLARGAARRREIAVRLAVGASSGRIVRQLLTETLVLFVAGGLLGLALSQWFSALLLSVLPQLPVPLHVDVAVDWRVAAFTAGMSAAAAVLCGLAPALQARRTSLTGALKPDALDGGSSRLRLRNGFVIAQITLSLVLVIAGGLFMRALDTAARTPTGFDAKDVDVVSLDLSLARLTPDTGRAFVRDLAARTRELPGVQAVSAAVDLPLDGGRFGFGSVRIPGSPGARADGTFPADWNVVEPGFFETLGIRLVQGRDFDDRDVQGAPQAAIVNEAFARAAWPGADPIGRQFESDASGDTATVTVVGVAADARMMSIGEPAEPYVYVPLRQIYRNRVNVLVKTSGGSAIPDVRTLVRAMNPNLPVTVALPLEEVTAIGTIPQRVAAAIAGTLGIVGLLLAGIGIYGVTAYAVTRRTREIGIRMALGAERAQIMRLLLRQGLVLTAVGVVAGAALAAAGSQLIRSLLHGVSGVDPATFGGAALLFAAVALMATWLPARRALTVDPMRALRSE